MKRSDLDAFPCLRSAFDFLGTRARDGSFLQHLLKNGFEPSVQTLERALSLLAARFTSEDLKEQISALFGDDDDWDKATTELLGLQLFNSLGCLEGVGWPPGAGDTPPFEGRIQVNGALIPFDIKSASGAGLRWIKEAITPIVEEWTKKAALPSSEIVFQWDGVITRQKIARHRKDIRTQLQDRLSSAAALPVEGIRIEVDDTTIEVAVRSRTGATVHGGKMGVKPHSDSIAATLRTHIAEKGQQAQNNGGVGFLIAYVRPPGCGDSDLSDHSLATALRSINDHAAALPHSNLWLGTLFLDWTRSSSDPLRSGIVRPSATWPAGSDHDKLCKALNLDVWPLQLSAESRHL